RSGRVPIADRALGHEERHTFDHGIHEPARRTTQPLRDVVELPAAGGADEHRADVGFDHGSAPGGGVCIGPDVPIGSQGCRPDRAPGAATWIDGGIGGAVSPGWSSTRRPRWPYGSDPDVPVDNALDAVGSPITVHTRSTSAPRDASNTAAPSRRESYM